MSQDKKPVNQMTEEELNNELRQAKDKLALTAKKVAVVATRTDVIKKVVKKIIIWGLWLFIILFTILFIRDVVLPLS